MKMIRIIALLLLVFSLMPLEAFCHDSHDADESHCAVACHSFCAQAIVVPAISSVSRTFAVSSFQITSLFLYQDPLLDTFKRPPVFSA